MCCFTCGGPLSHLTELYYKLKSKGQSDQSIFQLFGFTADDYCCTATIKSANPVIYDIIDINDLKLAEKSNKDNHESMINHQALTHTRVATAYYPHSPPSFVSSHSLA